MTFVVLNVENVPEHLRGYLERFLQEARTGMYVGTLSARVADHLWQTVLVHAGPGDAIMIRPDDSEAGYKIQARDHPRWGLSSYDGWTLSSTKLTSPEHKP